MMHYSVLIPERNSIGAVSRLLPQLCQLLNGLLLPYEIICIDDASEEPAAENLAELLGDYMHLRVLRFDRSRGISAALCAGVLAARGDLVIALGANTRFSLAYIPHLIARLSQTDLVVARPERSLAAEISHPFSRLAHLAAGSPELLASEDLFWAARREALHGLALPRGAFRALPELVAKRGFRVCQLTLAAGLPPRGATFRPGVVQRMIAGWLDRRFEPHLARELIPCEVASLARRSTRVDVARPRYVPQAAIVPAESVPMEKDRDSV
jgi:hypothetical protein